MQKVTESKREILHLTLICIALRAFVCKVALLFKNFITEELLIYNIIEHMGELLEEEMANHSSILAWKIT